MTEHRDPNAVDVTREEFDELRDAVRQYERRVTWILRGFVVLLVALAITGTVIVQKLDGLTSDIHDSVCALRVNSEARVETSREFLEENPEGIPGIDDEIIQQSIDNNLQTIAALSVVEC